MVFRTPQLYSPESFRQGTFLATGLCGVLSARKRSENPAHSEVPSTDRYLENWSGISILASQFGRVDLARRFSSKDALSLYARLHMGEGRHCLGPGARCSGAGLANRSS